MLSNFTRYFNNPLQQVNFNLALRLFFSYWLAWELSISQPSLSDLQLFSMQIAYTAHSFIAQRFHMPLVSWGCEKFYSWLPTAQHPKTLRFFLSAGPRRKVEENRLWGLRVTMPRSDTIKVCNELIYVNSILFSQALKNHFLPIPTFPVLEYETQKIHMSSKHFENWVANKSIELIRYCST